MSTLASARFDLPSAREKIEVPLIPEGEVLREAFQYHLRGDLKSCKAMSKAWLMLAHNATIGHIVTVYGWVIPRELLLEDFHIEWSSSTDYRQATLVFTGPTVMPRGVEHKTSVVRIRTQIARRKEPSKRLLKGLQLLGKVYC